MSLLKRILGRSPAIDTTQTEINMDHDLESPSYESRRAALAARQREIEAARDVETTRAKKIVDAATKKRDVDLAAAEKIAAEATERAADAVVADLWREGLPLAEAWVREPTRCGATAFADVLARATARCLLETGAELWGMQLAFLLGVAMRDERAVAVLGVDHPFLLEHACRAFNRLSEPAAFSHELAKLEAQIERHMTSAPAPADHIRRRFDIRCSCATRIQQIARVGAFDAERDRLPN